MTWSKPALPVGTTYFSRIAWSADGEPVKRPVFMRLGSGSFLIVSARASAAAIHASSEVRLSAQAQAAAGVFAPLGTTKAVPLATVNGLPSLSLNGTALMVMLDCVAARTFGYHCALISDATWSFTYWFSAPNMSNVSMKLFTL